MKWFLMKKYLPVILMVIVLQNYNCTQKSHQNVTQNISTPIVNIMTPTSSKVMGDSVFIQVSATDDKGIVKVELYIDNQIPPGGTMLVSPYIYRWDVESNPDGSGHIIYAKAYDGDNNVTSTEVKTVYSYTLAPTLLQLKIVGDTVIVLSWKDNSNEESGFEIEQRVNEGMFTLIETVGENVTTAFIQGFNKNDDTLSFRVRGVNASSKSRYSDIRFLGFDYHDMILVEGGTFLMGSASSIDNAAYPIHSVTLSNFSIKKTEVTQSEWKNVIEWKNANGGTKLNYNPSLSKGDQLPVDRVNWDEVKLWLSYLNEKENTTRYRLPTEAEWEFAARGGKKSKGYVYSGSNDINEVSWNFDNASRRTHPVATKMPNELGIYDMSGNCWEWCEDWYSTYEIFDQTDPTGPNQGAEKILRSGGALHDTGSRVAFRAYISPSVDPPVTYGFRYAIGE